jgi:hypothetical protein
MAFHKVNENGADPPIREDEQLVCEKCKAEFPADDTEQLWSPQIQRGRCLNCGTIGQFVKRKVRKSSAVPNRWTKAVADVGWTPVPDLLLKHQRDLGLKASDLVVLLNLEHHRRQADQMVWPSAKTIAKRSGLGERTVRTSMRRLSDQGLIEVHSWSKPDGGTTSNRSTALGLRLALGLIAENVREGREANAGLDELLLEMSAGKRDT